MGHPQKNLQQRLGGGGVFGEFVDAFLDFFCIGGSGQDFQVFAVVAKSGIVFVLVIVNFGEQKARPGVIGLEMNGFLEAIDGRGEVTFVLVVEADVDVFGGVIGIVDGSVGIGFSAGTGIGVLRIFPTFGGLC